jgi:hypothetical protein
LQGDTTTGGTTLRADAQKRGDAVDGEGEVKDRVQRKVGWWGCWMVSVWCEEEEGKGEKTYEHQEAEVY